jgi:MoxR-like ATPase
MSPKPAQQRRDTVPDEAPANAPKADPPYRSQFFAVDGNDVPPDDLPPAPGWRDNSEAARRDQGAKFWIAPNSKTVALVNAALLLRRPILVTGRPGTGKSTLARAVAERLKMGPLLEWSITTKTTLQAGLYQYDAIGRLNAASILRQRLEMRDLLHRLGEREAGESSGLEEQTPPQGGANTRDRDILDIGRFIHLGPLGTALACPLSVPGRAMKRPRVLLIDEIDKGDIDLPNDLLHVFEKGEFDVIELKRLSDDPRYQSVTVGTHDGGSVAIPGGHIRCEAFPLVVMTSNGERVFPPAFLRRCLQLKMEPPKPEELKEIVKARIKFEATRDNDVGKLITRFLDLRDGSKENPQTRELAVDQLLNAVYLLLKGAELETILDDALFQTLTGAP